MPDTYDEKAFAALQQRLVPMWPGMTTRAVGDMDRTILVVSSISVDVPSIAPVLPAYEERYLFMVLSMVRSPRTHVVYVTSLPMLPRLVDYYLGLTSTDLDADLASRLTVISVGDGSAMPLTQKILERPRLIARIRSLVHGRPNTLLLPFMTTRLEADLAVALDVPLYGAAPSVSHLGTKMGSREVFAAAGVPMARGVAGVRSRDDVVAAIHELQRDGPVRRYVVKCDEGVGGLGNALVDLGDGAGTPESAVSRMRPEDPGIQVEEFLDLLGTGGGVVEEWLDGDEVASPSIQLRASPLGEVEVLSTHDQLLGGAGGQTFLGCVFPARSEFVPPLTRAGLAIGAELATRGVIGRFGIDFVMVRRGETWFPYAIEINLRNGGTTHPALTLLALTGGSYDEATGQFLTRTGPKHYYATDHLERPEYRRLTPDDVLDLVDASGLGWDDDDQVGVALHMVSAVSVAGRLGATAIGNSPAHARDLYERTRQCLDEGAGVT